MAVHRYLTTSSYENDMFITCCSIWDKHDILGSFSTRQDKCVGSTKGVSYNVKFQIQIR